MKPIPPAPAWLVALAAILLGLGGLFAVQPAVLPVGAADDAAHDNAAHDEVSGVRLDLSDDALRVVASNAGPRPVDCRLRLDLQRHPPADGEARVDVVLSVPAASQEVVVWQAIGDLTVWRVAAGWGLDCPG